MKNTFYGVNNNKEEHNKALKEACIRAAVEYAGLDLANVIVEKAQLTEDETGTWYEVVFREQGDNSYDCGMGWCSYVDVFTGEVVGFMGSMGSLSVSTLKDLETRTA